MSKGFTLVEIIVVALVVLVILGILIPQYVVNRNEKFRESEAKDNLHQIQLLIERFATDYEGVYPQYLIGGSFQDFPIDPMPSAHSLDGKMIRRYRLSDALLRRGYLDSYPRNPFAGNGKKILEHQAKVGDPLRPGAEGDESGYRFGEGGKTMGNVMADRRFPTFTYISPGVQPEEVDSHADFDGYPFYDIWEGKKPKFYLPGEFFYKSNGPIVAVNVEEFDTTKPIEPMNVEDFDITKPIQPIKIDQYIMGVYGSTRNKGVDVFGPEPDIIAYNLVGESTSCGEYVIPSWTRWNKAKPYEGQGSPYSVSTNQQIEQLSVVGNPNGILDGVALIFNSDMCFAENP